MDLGLTDRVYVVTGGSGGLGLATAEVLVGEGARVVLSGRHPEPLDRAADALGERAVGVVADNAEADTPQRLIAAATETFGRLDGALISVGGPAPGSLMDSSDEDWARASESVLLGGVRLLRELGRALGECG